MKTGMHICLIMLMTLLTLQSGFGESRTDKIFDFSGLDQFFKIVTILEKDIEPTEAQWNQLFTTPGYAELTRREFKKEFFKENFSLALMPSKAIDYQEKLDKLGEMRSKGFKFRWEEMALKHFQDVIKRKSEVETFVQTLRNSDMVRRSMNKMLEYFPKDIQIEEYPKIAILIFGKDARGYDPVIMDIGYLMEYGPNLHLLFAHEFHHYYLDKMWRFDGETVRKEDEYMIWAMGQIYREGLADQIDKTKNFFTDPVQESKKRMAKRFREAVDQTPSIIKKLNDILEKMADTPGNQMALSKEFAATVPWSGHPTGYYMARAILTYGGKKELLKDMGNPFSFFKTYNRIAEMKKNDLPTFTRKTIKFIEELKNTYCQMKSSGN